MQEYALTPTTVASGQFGKRWSCAVDGTVYAQPLYMANLAIAGGIHNVLFVATSHDSVYAFNADDPGCGTYWKISFINPANGITSSTPKQASSGCGDIAEYGVTPTPVIDPVAGTMYVLAATIENGTYVQRLHSLNVATGADRTTPVQIQATVSGTPYSQLTDSFDASIENPRPGLMLTAGGVYLGWSSFCDVYPWQGWFMRYDAASLNQTAVFNVSPNAYAGSIWMSGGAPAVDSSGSIYLATGNGPFDDTSNVLPPVAPNNDFGMSILRLDPSSLVVQDFFTPAQAAKRKTRRTALRGLCGAKAGESPAPPSCSLVARTGPLGHSLTVAAPDAVQRRDGDGAVGPESYGRWSVFRRSSTWRNFSRARCIFTRR